MQFARLKTVFAVFKAHFLFDYFVHFADTTVVVFVEVFAAFRRWVQSKRLPLALALSGNTGEVVILQRMWFS